ncbi:hypothetical protein BGX34_011831 [Mortierella sp. NVP85]|nr:hypothetical protein BGX34_011831 [Mortierella sp. NVP85]
MTGLARDDPQGVSLNTHHSVSYTRTMNLGRCAYAIFLCGNPGVGKSTLANALGANFVAGFSLGEGLTKNVSFCKVSINEDLVLLIDAPGLYEASKERTQENAKEIQKALGVGLPYKIAFVVFSNGGRWLPQDVAIIDNVMKAVKASNGSPIEYILIINRIQKADWEHYMDQKKLNTLVLRLIDATNCKPKFWTTLCLPEVPKPSEDEMLKAKLKSAFELKPSYHIEFIDSIAADPYNLKAYEKVLLVIFSPVWGPILGLCAAYSSIKNKIRYDDWRPFVY